MKWRWKTSDRGETGHSTLSSRGCHQRLQTPVNYRPSLSPPDITSTISFLLNILHPPVTSFLSRLRSRTPNSPRIPSSRDRKLNQQTWSPTLSFTTQHWRTGCASSRQPVRTCPNKSRFFEPGRARLGGSKRAQCSTLTAMMPLSESPNGDETAKLDSAQTNHNQDDPANKCLFLASSRSR